MWCVGHVFPRADPHSSCGQHNTEAECLQKGSHSLGPGKRWVGVRSTVAHKRISPPHKDSGPLLSLTRSTKEMTFVCFGGRRGCVRTVQPGGRRRRRWQWCWGFNDRRGGWDENTRLTPFICSGLLFHRASLALSNGLLLCLFTPWFLPWTSDSSIGHILSAAWYCRPPSPRSMRPSKDRFNFLLMIPSFSDFPPSQWLFNSYYFFHTCSCM